ncbi:MAG: preprotein translocase subunit SecE [Bifidobacteriaceae bacterium]|nr:preprotein translocase subunit SecE [Bifidobacteriaceae bacterium]
MAKTASDAQVEKTGVFASIVRFVRQIVSEMKKVVWPSRSELWTYATVVLVFVIITMIFIGVFDLGINWLVGHVFAK